MFTPRLTRPEAGNKYYIRRSTGGYSTAIAGKPTDAGCDVLANCVGYAVGRFHEIAQHPAFDLLDPVNAENLYANAQMHGLRTGNQPELGALIVWQKGKTQSGSDGAGHVGVVEQIRTDGSIVTSESGYGAANPFWTAAYAPPYRYGAEYTLLGFVYQPESVPGGVIRKGDRGDAVTWLQTHLAALGYLRQSEIDGDFGKITLCSVAGFQLENGLEVDGVAGPATQAALVL